MNLILLLAFCMAATGKFLEVSKDHTSKEYVDSSPIFFSGEQNRFLSLPEAPSKVSNGSIPIDIGVPAPLKHYIWELNGYYLAQETGNHFFFIDDTEIAIIQLGWKLPMNKGRQNQVVEDEYVFSNWPRSYKLKKGNYYPVKISYIGGPDFVPVYARLNDKKQEISKRIYTTGGVPFGVVPSRDDYKQTGFAYKVFPAPRGSRYKRLLKEHRDYAPLAEGHFDESYTKVSPESRDSPYILEVLGHFSPPKDGNYTVKLDGQVFSIVQIGPGFKQKKKKYTINAKWTLFDNRLVSSPSFVELQTKLHYPFRIVILDKKKISNWETVVIDSGNNEVDLFRLWETPELFETPTLSKLEQGSILEAPPSKTSDDSVSGSSGALSPDSTLSEVISSTDSAANSGFLIPGANLLPLDPAYEGLEGPFEVDENNELDFNLEIQSSAPGPLAEIDFEKEPEILEQSKTKEVPEFDKPFSFSSPIPNSSDLESLEGNHSDINNPYDIPESVRNREEDIQFDNRTKFGAISQVTNPEELKSVVNEPNQALDPNLASSLETRSPVMSSEESFSIETPLTVEIPVSSLLDPCKNSDDVPILVKSERITTVLSKKRPKTVRLKKFQLDFDEELDAISKVNVQNTECLIDTNCEQFLSTPTESDFLTEKKQVITQVVGLSNTFESPFLAANGEEIGTSCLKTSCDKLEPTSTAVLIPVSPIYSKKPTLQSEKEENLADEGILSSYVTRSVNENGLLDYKFAKKEDVSSFSNRSMEISRIQQLEIFNEEAVTGVPEHSGESSNLISILGLHPTAKTSKDFSTYKGSGSVQRGNCFIALCFSISILVLASGL